MSLLLLLGFLTACQKNEPAAQVPSSTEEESQAASQESPVREAENQADFDRDGLKPAWTDYSHYAKPNEKGFAYYMYDDPDVSSEIMPLSGESSDKVLLFTFDDAPAEPNSQMLTMAELMKSKNVNAIFLVNGMRLSTPESQALLKQVYDMGFEIGNHTTTHANLRELTYEQQYEEIKGTSDLVEDITGEAPRWFRPPFGLFNMDTINICNDLGMQLMTWNFGYDWMDEYLEADPLVDISLNNEYLRAGGNILMHDRPWTREALERMIDGYRERGYEIVDPLLIEHKENSTAPLDQ